MTWALIPLAFIVPYLDSTKPPYYDLTHSTAQLAYLLSRSGGKYGIPILATLMLTLLVTRRGISGARRWKEAIVVAFIAALFGGGGAALNEHVIKERIQVPRPNIVFLAGENGSGSLGMIPEEFYTSGDSGVRSELLEKSLQRLPASLQLSSAIASHWIETTGYSFPSGHSYSAMFYATFFLILASTYLKSKRIRVFYALLPWALGVCYSRAILRVHTPNDIVVGGLFGLAVGLFAWAIARSVIRRLP